MMKKQRKKIIVIFAACMLAMMMMMNVSTTVNGTNFSVEGYTALVSGSTGGGSYYMTTTYCWVTGQPMWICKQGGGTCCISCQDTCSSS